MYKKSGGWPYRKCLKLDLILLIEFNVILYNGIT